MKVTAFVGSAQKRHTYHATELFLQKLQLLGDIDSEIVVLSDYNLHACRGCRLCLDHGEELCPLKDDRDLLFEKIRNSDGVVFASPNYSFQVSGILKVFFDRFGYMFHRPPFFGKTYTCIVTEGIYGGKKILKYINFIGYGLGFNTVKGSSITTVEPISEEREKENAGILEKHCKKFYARLIKNQYPEPSLFSLMMFRMARSSMKIMLGEDSPDFRYYNGNGWFESDYYYPVHLNPIKRIAGRLFDSRVSYVARVKGKVGFI